jgi:hypothetical protein
MSPKPDSTRPGAQCLDSKALCTAQIFINLSKSAQTLGLWGLSAGFFTKMSTDGVDFRGSIRPSRRRARASFEGGKAREGLGHNPALLPGAASAP